MPQNLSSYRLFFHGIVQGVGFRPFFYRLALRHGLKGFVRNDEKGVEAVVEGEERKLKNFLEALPQALPPLSRIDGMEVRQIPSHGYECFEILSSQATAEKSTAVSPDIAVCYTCLAEMRDPANRRFGHPFITCTDCGPRYSIIRTVPYDRPNTSMASFSMCDACKTEYEDPTSRRYHAQPIACPECGPTLSLLCKDDRGEWRKEEGEQGELIEKVVRRIRNGEIVAIKGLGGFHLICDATHAEAVAELRRRKRRPAKPFALMVKDLKMAEGLAQMDENERSLLLSKERPIVLLRQAFCTQSILNDSPVAPGIDRIGLMLPYTPLHHLLFEHLDVPIVATSANLSDEPIIRDGEELRKKLGNVVDGLLDHDREIVNACDDSVAQIVDGRVQWLRVARGITPLTLTFDKTVDKPILGVGANQKNTITLTFGNKIVVSPHIGDLGSLEAMEYFDRTVKTFERFYEFKPQTVVTDLHPLYESTKWAQRKTKNPLLPLMLQKVQHHYAHALAVMAEHGWREKALAIVWDGTGYGEDGTIWGGEAMIVDVYGFERIASLRPFRLLGGEKAVKEPRRVALALLFEFLELEEVLALRNPTVESFRPEEIRLLHRAWERGANVPTTSSMGRLFDGVASLMGLCQQISYEGESGLLLEAQASKDGKWTTENGELGELLVVKDGIIDWEPLLRRLIEGRLVPAAAFIQALAEIIVSLSDSHPNLPLILTGGVFQNRTLMEKVLPLLQDRELMLPEQLPPNDGGIALGQVWYALNLPVEEDR
ncbi:carbamoyltransferase HypF [Hydrogenimonas urashimensis]|uniref:carbamoyltransferase HypF n=1 Tax=Hydrogenimonas urashimensis TaxID=2740515 RepID=UPI001916838D|nr:carbamoyltransferase HypF [Hydrogenimonas urashimensis]